MAQQRERVEDAQTAERFSMATPGEGAGQQSPKLEEWLGEGAGSAGDTPSESLDTVKEAYGAPEAQAEEEERVAAGARAEEEARVDAETRAEEEAREANAARGAASTRR